MPQVQPLNVGALDEQFARHHKLDSMETVAPFLNEPQVPPKKWFSWRKMIYLLLAISMLLVLSGGVYAAIQWATSGSRGKDVMQEAPETLAEWWIIPK